MTNKIKEPKHIISHPAFIRAILDELKNNGIELERNRLFSVGTKTQNIVVAFTSDYDKKVHTIRLPKTLEYLRRQDVSQVVSKIMLEIHEDNIKPVKKTI